MTTDTRERSHLIRVADVIALYRGQLVLIERLREPFGLALPGGHVDPGELPRETAIREFKEETGLVLNGARFFTRRMGRKRDPRYAMSRTRVYVGEASGKIRDEAGLTKVVLMDPKRARVLPRERFAFDHWSILKQYFAKHP